MISHQNIIANIIQHSAFESVARAEKGVKPQAISGFLPFSHIYALIVACHTATWRGEEVIVLPKFDFNNMLKAIQTFKIEQLFVVSP
jgi:acyl-CoA synthetase (AMP-forming)/AMP-acid ligase II